MTGVVLAVVALSLVVYGLVRRHQSRRLRVLIHRESQRDRYGRPLTMRARPEDCETLNHLEAMLRVPYRGAEDL